MYRVRSILMLLLLPHRRMIGIVFSHPHRTEPIGTPSFYYTYNPVIRERRHGKGVSRMWQENHIYWPRFYTSGFSGFPDPPVCCEKDAKVGLEKSSSHMACRVSPKDETPTHVIVCHHSLITKNNNQLLLHKRSIKPWHLCVFTEKRNSAYYAKCVNDPQL